MSWIKSVNYKGIDFEIFGDWEAHEGTKVCVLVGREDAPEVIREHGDLILEALQYFADNVEELMIAGWAGDWVYWLHMRDEDPTEVERIAKIVINSPSASEEAIEYANYALRGIFPDIGRVTKQKKNQAQPGYVYLAYSETDHHKIGRSVGPEDRIEVFNTKMPVEVTMVHTFEADDMVEAETNLHNQYASKRVKGEWFNLGMGDVEAITAIVAFRDGVFIYEDNMPLYED